MPTPRDHLEIYCPYCQSSGQNKVPLMSWSHLGHFQFRFDCTHPDCNYSFINDLSEYINGNEVH